MADQNITCTPTDIWTGTDKHTLPKPITDFIWNKAVEKSAVMAASTHLPIPGSGVEIPVITGDAQASWVGETCAKPVGVASWGYRTLKAYKMAVIEIFSKEFIRDRRALYNELVKRLPNSLGTLFDETVFGTVTKPGEYFDSLGDAPIVDLDSAPSTYGGLTNVLTEVSENGGDISAWLASPALQARLLTATDALGHPFFASNPAGQRHVGSVFGAPVYKEPKNAFKPGIIGVAGDFADGAVYGTVGGITISRSTEASVVLRDGTVVNLWQQNMVGILVEFEVGFVVRDKNLFVQIAGTATGGQAQSGLGASGLVNVDSQVVDVKAQVVTVKPDGQTGNDPEADSEVDLAADAAVAEALLANSEGVIDVTPPPVVETVVEEATAGPFDSPFEENPKPNRRK